MLIDAQCTSDWESAVPPDARELFGRVASNIKSKLFITSLARL